MPRWMEPVIPHLQPEASPAADAAAPALTGAPVHPAEPPAGQSGPAQARTTHAALTAGKPESRHPRAHGNHAGVAMGPHMRRLHGPGVTTAARTSSS